MGTAAVTLYPMKKGQAVPAPELVEMKNLCTGGGFNVLCLGDF